MNRFLPTAITAFLLAAMTLLISLQIDEKIDYIISEMTSKSLSVAKSPTVLKVEKIMNEGKMLSTLLTREETDEYWEYLRATRRRIDSNPLTR